MLRSYSKIDSNVLLGERFKFKESHFPGQNKYLILYDNCLLVMILIINFRIYLCRCTISQIQAIWLWVYVVVLATVPRCAYIFGQDHHPNYQLGNKPSCTYYFFIHWCGELLGCFNWVPIKWEIIKLCQDRDLMIQQYQENVGVDKSIQIIDINTYPMYTHRIK